MKLHRWQTRSMFDRYNIIDAADRAAAVGKRFTGEQAANIGPAAQEPGLLSSGAVSSAA
jgi:hypothetical protein